MHKLIISLLLICVVFGCKSKSTMTNAQVRALILDTPIIIDHGDYLEVRFTHTASFTTKPKSPFAISGTSAEGENGTNYDTTIYIKSKNNDEIHCNDTVFLPNAYR